MPSVFMWWTFPQRGRCVHREENSLLNSMDSLWSQHLEQEEYDIERTAYLESKGYRILRFWNKDVMNDIEGVLRSIDLALVEGDKYHGL